MADDERPPTVDDVITAFRARQEKKRKRALEVLSGDATRKPQPLGTVIRSFLHRGSLTLVYGPPKSGKSFLVTDAFLSVANGDPEWMGHRIVRAGPVLYVACEGHGGFWKRMEAAAQHRGLFGIPEQFHLARGRPALVVIDPKTHIALPHPQDILEAILDLPVRPVAVAIDTVYRAMGGGNVNSSDHTNAFLGAVAAIMDLGIAVVCVHHEVKAGGTPAGSVALLGGADTIVKTTNGDATHSWEVEFAKDDALTKPRAFKLEVKELGEDLEGEPASSCVVIAIDGPVEGKKPGRRRGPDGWPASALLLRKALMNTLAEHGRNTRPYANGPEVRAIQAEIVRQEFYRDHPNSDPAAKRQAWKRALDTAKQADLIGSRDTDGSVLLWLIQPIQQSMDV
jgi:hypothetical protein